MKTKDKKHIIAEKQRQALRYWKDKLNLSVLGWAREAGISESALRLFLDGINHSMGSDNLELLANAIGKTISTLFDIEGKHIELPVAHYIGDRGELFPLAEPEYIPASDNLPEDSAAAVVKGDFLLPFFQEGDMFVYSKSHKGEVPLVMNARQVNYSNDNENIANKPCVIELKDGRLLFRKLKPSFSSGKFSIYGYNFREEEEVEIVDAYKIIFAKFG